MSGSFRDQVIRELRELVRMHLVSDRAAHSATCVVRDDPDRLFTDDSVLSVTDAADLALNLGRARLRYVDLRQATA